VDLSLRGYVTAVLRARPAAEHGALADQLQAVADLVTTNADLASTLSDVAVPSAVRRAVVSDLLASKVAEPVLRIVLHAEASEHPANLLSALHSAAELARLRADLPDEADAADDRPIGHGALRRLLGGMVAAVLETVPNVADIEEIEDELFRFSRIVAASPQLASVLADWSVPAGQRAELASSLLAGKTTAATVALVTAAVRLRTRDVVVVLDWLAEQAAAARGWRVARVRAAMEVDDDARRRLGDAMAKLTGKPVEVEVTVDPALLGGARVEIGDLLVDATTRHRLDLLQDELRNPDGMIQALLGPPETTRTPRSADPVRRTTEGEPSDG